MSTCKEPEVPYTDDVKLVNSFFGWRVSKSMFTNASSSLIDVNVVDQFG
jgi:hypothetical protein